MQRMTVISPLLIGLLALSSCAESIHQTHRNQAHLNVPPELEQQIDRNVTYAELQAAPDNYIGRVVMVGGVVIGTKRTKERTEIEILQLPMDERGPTTTERLRSEGRFLAVREEFLDPATVPPSAPITVVGVVLGSVTRPLDESEYRYPILDIKHIIDWTAMATQQSNTAGSYFGPYYGPYYSPYAYWGGLYRGYYPYGWGPYPYVYRPSPPPPPPPPPQKIPPQFRKRR